MKQIKTIENILTLTITISIFFMLFVKIFFDLFRSEDSNIIYFKYSSLVIIYILNYVIFYISKNKLKKNIQITNIIEYLLITNLLLMGLSMAYMINIEEVSKLSQIMIDVLKNSFVTMLYIISLIIPLMILLLLVYNGFIRKS